MSYCYCKRNEKQMKISHFISVIDTYELTVLFGSKSIGTAKKKK